MALVLPTTTLVPKYGSIVMFAPEGCRGFSLHARTFASTGFSSKGFEGVRRCFRKVTQLICHVLSCRAGHLEPRFLHLGDGAFDRQNPSRGRFRFPPSPAGLSAAANPVARHRASRKRHDCGLGDEGGTIRGRSHNRCRLTGNGSTLG